MSKDLMPPKKVYDLTEVEFLDWITTQSQEERPLFSDSDVTRFGEMAGTAPRLSSDGLGKNAVAGYRMMPYVNIKDLLDHVWATRDRKFAAEKAS